MGNQVYLSIVLLLCISKGMYIRRDKLSSYLEATGVVVFHLSVRGFCFEFKYALGFSGNFLTPKMPALYRVALYIVDQTLPSEKGGH
jgi:hypothetical protein